MTNDARQAVARLDEVGAWRGARDVNILRETVGIALGALVLITGELDPVWRDRALYGAGGMAASALMMLIYLRNARPLVWLAWILPLIDVAAVMSLALATGGAHSPATLLFFVIIAVNGLALRDGPLLATVVYVSIASVTMDRLGAPLDDLGRGLTLVAYWLTALTTARIIRSTRGLTVESLEHQASRNSILRTFGQHVSPQVVDALLAQGESVQSSVRHVSVLFLDIRGFTTLSETRPPEQVVALLNDLFGFMIEEINRHEGIINKFLGDGFMAVFGAPISSGEDARNSVAAARAILARLDAGIQAGRLPPLRIGIGIHAGPAVTGSVGSEDRKEYTLIGDVVNVASRVEGMTKELGCALLVTDVVWAAQPAGARAQRVHEGVVLRGRQEAMALVELG